MFGEGVVWNWTSKVKRMEKLWIQMDNGVRALKIGQLSWTSYVYFFFIIFFFLSGFSFTDTDNSQDNRGRKGTFLYSSLPLPAAHKHSDIYVQLYTWDNYHIFLIATLVFTRLLLGEIYHLIELLFDWLIMWLLI